MLAENAAVVAVSPDGSKVLVTKEPDPSPAVALVDVADGRELATFSFSDEVDPVRGEPIYYVAESGSWVGETAVAGVTGGLAVFSISGGEIILEKLLGVDPNDFPLGLMEPNVVDDKGARVVAVAELMQRPRAPASRSALMECDLIEHECVLGRSAPSYQPPRPIYNPSRP